MADLIQVPNFQYGFFYPDILESLILFKRKYAPEITDESEHEPFIQLLRAFALVGHQNNVMLDQAANESTLPTARLAETIRSMLRLIDYELRPGTPAQTDLVYELARPFNATTEIAPPSSQSATKRTNGDTPVVFFEDLNGTSVARTDLLSVVLEETPAGAFVDRTAAANSGSGYTPTFDVGTKLYFGHADAMWDQLELNVTAASAVLIGVWEFFNASPTAAAFPSSVSNVGGGRLQIGINSLVGPENRAGLQVVVSLNSSTSSETAISTWDGASNVVTIGLLGQSAPSSNLLDYSIKSSWQEVDGIVDATINLTITGLNSVSYNLPQDTQRDWSRTKVNGIDGYFLRFRVVETTVSSAPAQGRARIDRGKTYAKGFATQGRSVYDETLGSSNGDGKQRFAMSKDHFILNSQIVSVNNEIWTEVKNFLLSQSQDKHYRLELGENDKATVVFGDGTNGKIPPIGQGNVVADYRYGAEESGNVGARTIIVDKTGLTFVNKVYNPRQATGWAQAQAATRATLEMAKEEGPASLRVRGVAISPEDLEILATSYVDSTGVSPFARARAIEEGFGPKTIETVVVARGGGLASTPQLAEFSNYVNGDKYATPPLPKRIVANQQAVPVNFQQRAIDIDVIVEAPAGVTYQQVTNQLSAVIQPEAKAADGVTWLWEFGAEIPTSRIVHEIFTVDSRITKVKLNTPAANTQLARRELPVAGRLTVLVVPKIEG